MHPFFDINLNRILQGNALEVLKTFPDNSIDCCVCSPPYWSLRDYNLPPQIWDGVQNCEHQWGECIERKMSGGTESEKVQIKGKDNFQKWESQSNFCSHCGAWKGSLGLEPSFTLFISHLIQIFTEVKRVLKPTGTCFVNLGDSYAGSGNGTNDYRTEKSKSLNGIGKYADKNYQGTGTARLSAKEKHHAQARYEPRAKTNEVQAKSLCQIPSRFAIAMTDIGWILRNTIIWHKPNCMPQSVSDRFTVDFEKMFFFVKSRRYYFQQQFLPQKEISLLRAQYKSWGQNGKSSLYENINGLNNRDYPEPNPLGRNMRCVWNISTGGGTSEEHFASYPPELIETPIRAGCPEEVCNNCGKPKQKILKQIGFIKEAQEGTILLNDNPYSVKERTGFVAIRNLPPIDELKNYLNHWRKEKNMTIEEIENKLNSQAPHHWFNGESYPTKEDWLTIKELLGFNSTYDNALTEEKYKQAEKLSGRHEEKYISCKCGAGFVPGIVLDPFAGTGTTAVVARKLNRNFIGIELNPDYVDICAKRFYKEFGMFSP